MADQVIPSRDDQQQAARTSVNNALKEEAFLIASFSLVDGRVHLHVDSYRWPLADCQTARSLIEAELLRRKKQVKKGPQGSQKGSQ